MANEITVTAKVRVSNGLFKFNADAGAVQFDQTVNGGGFPGVTSVPAAGVNLSFGTTDTVGLVWIRNLSTGSLLQIKTTGNLVMSVFQPKMTGIIPKYTSTIWKLATDSTGGAIQADIRGFHQ